MSAACERSSIANSKNGFLLDFPSLSFAHRSVVGGTAADGLVEDCRVRRQSRQRAGYPDCAEAATAPAQNGGGLDDHQTALPICPPARQEHPEQPLTGAEVRTPCACSLQHRELMAQHNKFHQEVKALVEPRPRSGHRARQISFSFIACFRGRSAVDQSMSLQKPLGK